LIKLLNNHIPDGYGVIQKPIITKGRQGGGFHRADDYGMPEQKLKTQR
jgi:hypothetical protein